MDIEYSLENKNSEESPSSDDYMPPFSQKGPVSNQLTFRVNRKEPKKSTKVIDSIYAMQNALLNKIKDSTYTEKDLFTFLVYDLIINHDKQFKRLKNKTKEVLNGKNEELMDKIDLLLLKEKIDTFIEEENILLEEMKLSLSKEESYSDNTLIYSPKLCNLIFSYVDVSAQTKCYKTEVETKKRFNYTNTRKAIFNQIYSYVKEGTTNVKLMGGAIYRECKRNRIGRCNGFTTNYLTLEAEDSETKISDSPKRTVSSDDRPTKGVKTIPTEEKLRMMRIPLDFYNDTPTKNKPINKEKEEDKQIKNEKKIYGAKFSDEDKESEILFNQEFLIGQIVFNENEEDPNLKYKFVFQDDLNDEYGYISKVQNKKDNKKEKEESSESL